MSLLVFCFRGTVAEEVAVGLASKDEVVLLDSTIEAIEDFVNKLDTLRPDRILGLGSYSGTGTSELRIETVCSNQFRNNTEDFHKVPIPFFLRSSVRLKLTNSIGNSWCNKVSYTIVTRHPDIPYSFLHIPKIFPPEEAMRAIKEQLNLDKTGAK
jgi:pyrrolidone-carboxylate peptidase